MNELIRLMHGLASIPWVYELIQLFAGVRLVKRRLGVQMSDVDAPSFIVDLGGGTGIYRDQWPRSVHYLCCDIDQSKLRRFVALHSNDTAILGDATLVPIRNAQADIVLCASVSHHLSEEMWVKLLNESSRLLRPGGKFILVEPLWVPGRLVGRLIWRLDRGSHPRTEEALRSTIAEQFEIRNWDRFAIFHEYVIAIALKV